MNSDSIEKNDSPIWPEFLENFSTAKCFYSVDEFGTCFALRNINLCPRKELTKTARTERKNSNASLYRPKSTKEGSNKESYKG